MPQQHLTHDGEVFHRSIHDIENTYFRSKFSDELDKYKGNIGIGVISDTDAQPIIVNSHLGKFAISTVAKINNLDELVNHCLDQRQHFAELSMGFTNPTELVALLITQGEDFVDGIKNVYQKVKGSCSMLILTEDTKYLSIASELVNSSSLTLVIISAVPVMLSTRIT